MSKRLQVVVSDEELLRYQRAATATGLTLSEWVRLSLRGAEQQVAAGAIEDKIAAVRNAVRYSFPAPDIDQMLRETELGALGEPLA